MHDAPIAQTGVRPGDRANGVGVNGLQIAAAVKQSARLAILRPSVFFNVH